jgi:hypothetical protein
VAFRVIVGLHVLKEHVCVNCGCVYRYHLIRKKSGRGATVEAAEFTAKAAANRAAETEVDREPCPECGLYQPDMIGRPRAWAHLMIYAATIGLVIVLTFAGCGAFRIPGAVLGAAGVCAAALLAHLCLDLWNPNRDLAANRVRAIQRVEEGRIAVAQPGNASPAGVSRAHLWPLLLVYGVLVLAVVVCAAPEGVRLLSGWTLNDSCDPPVVGPGEKVRVEFPRRLGTVGGKWNGQAEVRLLNGEENRLPADYSIPVSTNSATWGDTIEVLASHANEETPVWAELYLPDDPSLAGKSLRLQIDLSVECPHGGPDGFSTVQDSFSGVFPIQVASTRMAGSEYNRLGLICVPLGCLLVIATTPFLIFRARAQAARALPTKVYIPGLTGAG